MKNKIRLVILLMSLCTLFLLGLQLYWNYQSYHSAMRVFKSDINDALDKAVTSEMNSKRDGFSRSYEKWLADTSLITLGVRYSDSMKMTIFSIRDTHPPFHNRAPFPISLHDFKGPLTTITPAIKAKFIVSFVRNMIANDLRSGSDYYYTQRLGDSLAAAFRRDKLDTGSLRELYRKELAGRAIESDFVLHISNYEFKGFKANAKAPAEPNKTRAFKYGFSAPALAVRAEFPEPNLVFIRKMKWVILSSLLLIGITIACFAFTVRTMLSQKKLAGLKDDFVNNMTHELKTPVATISIAAEAIQDFKVNPETAGEYLSIIRHQSGNLSHLIDQLLKSMLNEQQAVSLQWERVSVNELVQQCLHQYQPVLSAKGAKVDTRMPATEVLIQGDAAHLGHVLGNLLDNAIKYGTQPPSITIKLSVVGAQAVVAVSNAGPPIPAVYRNQIFERFFRVPSGNIHDVKGYGLGLSYVKEIVRQHRGRIDLDCAGSLNTFTITLPLSA